MNTIISAIKSLVRHPIYFLQALSVASRNTDTTRWTDPKNLKTDWDERTVLMASLIPLSSSVIEFGAARLVLRDHLPKDCTYQPSDLVDRGDSTIVCDLNVDFPTLSEHYSHAVFSGVLEYIVDLDRLLRSLAPHVDYVVASYAASDFLSDYATRIKNGWINHFTRLELLGIFHRHGFILERSVRWRLQEIYCFKVTHPDESANIY